MHNVVSGDVDLDSFGMAPWDAGGMHDDRCQLREALRTMMRLLCRPVIVHGLNRTMSMNTENGLDTIMMITTDSPRLTVTPGEWYASDVLAQIRCDLRHTYDISAAVDCNAVEPNDLIFRRLSLPPGDVSAGRNENYGSPKMDSAAADSGAVEMDDLIFPWLSLPPEDVSAGRDGHYGSFKIDSAVVDFGTGAVGLDDLILRRLSFPPEEFAAGWDTAAAACDAMKLDDMIFRRTNLPPDEFSAGRNGDYIWRDLWTRPSVCNRPVTGPHGFGSSQRLGRCCLWLAALPVRWKGRAEVPQCHLLTRWLAEHLMMWTCLSTLLCIVTFSEMCLPSGAIMIWS